MIVNSVEAPIFFNKFSTKDNLSNCQKKSIQKLVKDKISLIVSIKIITGIKNKISLQGKSHKSTPMPLLIKNGKAHLLNNVHSNKHTQVHSTQSIKLNNSPKSKDQSMNKNSNMLLSATTIAIKS